MAVKKAKNSRLSKPAQPALSPSHETKRIHRRDSVKSLMAVQDDRQGELNILVRGRQTADEVRKEDEGYGGGEMGKK